MNPPPSTLQTRRSPVMGSQLRAEGSHTATWQRPSRQVCPAAQAVTALPEPRASQVRWRATSSQRVSEGVHTCRRHRLSGSQ